MLSHRNLIVGAESVSEYLGNTADDVILAVLPLSFDAGLSQVTTAFAVGAHVVLVNYLLPKDVRVPGILVDCVVVAEPEMHRMNYGVMHDAALAGEIRVPVTGIKRMPLNERKIIERAKGLLMATRKLSEADAHKMLRQTAMNQNRRLLDVAQSVLALSDYL